MPASSALTLPKVSAVELASRSASSEEAVQSAIQLAFGQGGPGILLVTDPIFTFAPSREKLLTAGRKLGSLSEAELYSLELADVHYSVGWSRGRERFRGVVDVNKGSFYANPVYDNPCLEDTRLVSKYPHYMTPNIWPEQPADLESSFKSLGMYIHSLGCELARHCDQYISSKLGSTPFSSLETSLRTSRAQKGRLLNYFPSSQASTSLWCGFHNDHATLTGLIAGQFFRDEQPVPAPDSTAGLYVHREGHQESDKVNIPSDCIAFQIGEAAQIASGGILRATPHAVYMPQKEQVSRVTLAVFLQPNPWEELRLPQVSTKLKERALMTSTLVPTLEKRYDIGDTFADFAAKTIKAYCT